jgi:hypothetical protein
MARLKHTSPRLFTYVISNDMGFAPNPFYQHCTLACCKPAIRRVAVPGDWVAGLWPKREGNSLVYWMRISEKITFAQYWSDPRFTEKKPCFRSLNLERQCGDNIYEPQMNGEFRQCLSFHSNGFSENPKKKKRDLSGKFVLIGTDFSYFGVNAFSLPSEFRTLIPTTQGHRSIFPPALVSSFTSFLCGLDRGLQGQPKDSQERAKRLVGIRPSLSQTTAPAHRETAPQNTQI